jgi:uncharacterized protein YndB with AHSA1/START domain
MPRLGAVAEQAPVDALVLVEEFECDAPTLWDAWTDARALVQWFGPPDWPAIEFTSDFRIGGRWHATLRSPADGTLLQQAGEYLSIDAPRLLRFSFRWLSDHHEDGPGVPTIVEVRLTPITGERTRLELRHLNLASDRSTRGHRDGWRGTLQRLLRYLEDRPRT